MGSTSRIFCNECDFNIYISTGPGMMYWSLDNIACPEEEEYGDIFNMRDSIKEKYNKVHESLQQSLYICDQCEFWDNKLSVKFIVKDKHKDVVYEYKHMCPKCSNELKEVSKEEIIKHIKCPKCNSRNLGIDIGWMLWD
ncbi:hypothetical protein [Terrisporobacter glycolicus]|uniref:hypothetical protein n=1 Tax=Terrisporobacter glycolicus TaxID=36841 RepID=UPI003463CAED